jgi:hypothetical protein
MMNIQLDMLSPLYYSTLGYDEELINYFSFIDDSFIYDLFPEYQSNNKGRTPNDPVVLFRMHFLYYTRPEFRSFRQMCEELNKPKHQDYRNFLGVKGIKVPSHGALSRFRKKLGLSELGIDEINKNVIEQAKSMEGFLNMMIGTLDSRPVFAAVGGFKKECTCGTPEDCKCEPRFSDKDATVGRQRIKVNQNKFFIGYRKNTVACPSSQGPMPITSVIVDAKTSDNKMLIPCLEQLDKVDVNLPYMIADMGYIDGEDKITAMKEHGTAVCTEVKKNMLIPEECDERGRVTCPEGHLAIYAEFDRETLTSTYCGDNYFCKNCIRNGICPKEFTHSFEKEPQFFGPIGQGSELQERMLRFRKQSELNFALEANLLDNVLHHKKLTVRGIKKVEIYLKLSDVFRLIIGMLHHAEEYFVPQGRSALLRRLAEQAIYDRVILRNSKVA